jgi:hypothetical protein
MSPLSDPEDLEAVTALVNSYAASDWLNLSFSKHARDQLASRVIPNDVVVMTLRAGKCVGFRRSVEKAGLRYAYEIEMVDKFGRVTVVTAIPGLHRLHIVTSFTDVPD